MLAKPSKPRSIMPLIAILLVCMAPVVFAFLAYYVPALGLRPTHTSNYGALIQPQRPVPAGNALALATLDGKPFDLHSLHGQWVLVTADQGACPDSCVRKLYVLRNAHASQGKDVKRLSRIWFVTDNAPIPAKVLDAYKGTYIVRVDPRQLAAYLAPEAAANGAQAALTGPMWVIDPLGNLMLQFPPEADPISVRQDLIKLLHNSQIG
jgi:hypothetical protein